MKQNRLNMSYPTYSFIPNISDKYKSNEDYGKTLSFWLFSLGFQLVYMRTWVVRPYPMGL